MKTHYEVLGIAQTATLDEIKAAYRFRAKETHPDGRGGSDAAHHAFLLVQQAFDVLSDADARVNYDRTIPAESLSIMRVESEIESRSLRSKPRDHKWEAYNAAWERYYAEKTNPNYRNYHIDPIDKPAYESDNNSIREKNEQPVRKVYVRPINSLNSDDKKAYEVDITLAQAFEGLKAYILDASKATCHRCDGKGYVTVAGTECRVCSGEGRAGHYGFVGRLLFGTRCENCGGAGNIRVAANCEICRGDGVETLSEETAIEIVRGVHNDGILLLSNDRGELRVKVLPHNKFVRSGVNLEITEYLTEGKARKGTLVNVPLLGGGSRSVFVMLESGDRKEYVIPGLGMPRNGATEFGDLVLTVVILKSRRQRKRSL